MLGNCNGNGQVGEWASGRVGEWASGRVGEWASGRVGEWASGRVGEWASVLNAIRQDVSRTRQDSMAIDNSSMAVYLIVEMFCRTEINLRCTRT